MKELHVTWQFTTLLVALILFPIILIPLVMTLLERTEVRAGLIYFTLISAVILIGMIAIAIRSRLRQTRSETRPDGQYAPRWLIRELVRGTALLALETGIILLVVTLWPALPRELQVLAGIPAIGPGLIIVGRAMIPQSDL